MDKLESYLEQLCSLHGTAYYDPVDIIQDMKALCFSGLAEEQLGMTAALLFSPTAQHSLIRFLEPTRGSEKKLVEGREHCLVFVAELIEYLGAERVQEHVMAIKEAAVNVFRKDQSNKTRTASFKALKALLSLDLQRLDAELLDIAALADIYLKEYTVGASKLSQTLKGEILSLLGLLCERYPEVMFEKVPRLLSLFIDILPRQFKSRKPDMQIIAGAFTALNSLLVHFSGDFQGVPAHVQQLFKYMCLGLSIPPELKRYAVPIASLKLLSTHAVLFKEYLTEAADNMFVLLTKLCKHQNPDVSRSAFKAMDAFFLQVSNEIVSDARSAASNQATFGSFMKKFFQMLDGGAHTEVEDMSIAIRGFGRFAAPTAKFASADDLQKVLSRLFHFSERFYQPDSNPEETSTHMSSFIGAFANILQQLPRVDELYLEHLERIVAAVFRYFPTLWPKQQQAHCYALSRLLYTLYSKQSALKMLLSRVFFQGIAFTCARHDSNEGLLDGEERFGRYLELWRNLLNPPRLTDCDASDAQLDDMRRVIHAQFVEALMRILQKLDVSYDSVVAEHGARASGEGAEQEQAAASEAGKGVEADAEGEEEEREPSADLFRDLKPRNPFDFTMFLNMVQFSRTLLLDVNTRHFLPWMYPYSRLVIQLSNRYPLISGFYKLLGVCMQLAKRHDYFEGVDLGLHSESMLDARSSDHGSSLSLDDDGLNDVPGDGTPMDTENIGNKQVCFVVMHKFLKEVLVRVQQYKEELLAACIELLLRVPRVFVDVASLVPVVKMALEMGLSYHALAYTALHALEQWVAAMPERIGPHLPRILPHLSEYLSLDAVEQEGDDDDEGDDVPLSALAAATSKRFKFKKLHGKVGRTAVASSSTSSRLQKRIVQFLGRLGGAAHAVVSGSVDLSGEGRSSIAWDAVQRVAFTLPLPDLRPELFLDPFLPPVVELALSSRDRQVKVAACELLHCLVLIMVGSGAHSHSSRAQYYKLYKHVFPALLRLACDIESVARQLFEPLVMQLIHWFTRNVHYENEETMNLLDAIVDAVGCQDNGALRDLAARCLGEFLLWSLKHSSGKKGKAAEEESINVRSLFKRLYSLAHHPNPYKRFGCALTMNEVYRTFREHERVVDVFLLEITKNMLFSLRLCDRDEESVGTADAIRKVLRSLARIIAHYSALLSKPNKARREFDSLDHFLEWLLEETARTETASRCAAMQLLERLCPLVRGCSSACAWVRRHVDAGRGIDWVVRMYEGADRDMAVPSLSGCGPGGAGDGGAVSHAAASELARDAGLFFRRLGATLHAYSWLIEIGALEAEALLGGVSPTRLPHWVESFLRDFALLDCTDSERTAALPGAAAPSDPDVVAALSVLSPAELERLRALKSAAMLYYFDALRVVAERQPDALGDVQLLGQATFPLLLHCMLLPTAIGVVEPGSAFALLERPKAAAVAGGGAAASDPSQVLHGLCSVLLRVPASLDAAKAFKRCAEATASSEACTLANIDLGEDTHVQRALGLVRGQRALLALGLLPGLPADQDAARGADALPHEVANALRDAHTSFSPTQLLVGQALMRFAVEAGLRAATLVDFLTDDAMAAARSGRDLDPGAGDVAARRASRGMLFLEDFEDVLVEHALVRPQRIVPRIMQHCGDSPVLFRLLLSCLERVAQIASGDAADHERPAGNVDAVVVTRRNAREFLEAVFEHVGVTEGWYAPPKKMRGAAAAAAEEGAAAMRSKALDLLRHAARADPDFVFDSARRAAWFRDAFCGLMDRTVPLPFKVEVLEQLPVLVRALPSSMHAALEGALSNMVVYDFPVRSSDLPRGSSLLHEYCAAVDRLLAALVQAPAPMLFRALLPVLRDREHVHGAAIDAALRACVSSLSDEQCRAAFDALWGEFTELSHQDSLRAAVVQKLLCPLAHHMSLTQAVQVFEERVVALMDILADDDFESSDRAGDPIDEHASRITVYVCALRLVQSMYDALPGKVVRDAINAKYCAARGVKAPKGNELTTAVMKLAHGAKSKQLATLGLPRALALEYQQAAYNALASVVIATQSKEQFFTVFFFKENAKKNERIWENIVDTAEVYHFEVETRPLPSVLDKITALRERADKARKKQQGEADAAARGGRAGASARGPYISSQYLANTSLSQELASSVFFERQAMPIADESEADRMELVIPIGSSLPPAVVSAEGGAARDKKSGAGTGEGEDDEAHEIDESEWGSLEMDSLNSNPCMVALLRLLDRMQRLFAPTGAPDEGDAAPEPPKWMHELLALMEDRRAHPNVHLFIAKMVVNRPKVFERYHRHWFSPLLSLCLSPAVGKGINYFLRDLLLLLIQWPAAKPTGDAQEEQASELMNLLTRYAFYDKGPVVRANVTLIRLLVERWAGRFHVSKKILMELMSVPDTKPAAKFARLTALQVLGILLANGYALYDTVQDAAVQVYKYYEALLGNLAHPRKEVYCSAAEVAGVALRQNEENRRQRAPTQYGDQFEKQLTERMLGMFGRGEVDRVLRCLDAVAVHHAPFLDQFYNRVFDVFPSTYGEFRSTALSLVLARAEHIEDMWDYMTPLLPSLISQRDEDVQQKTLQMLLSLPDRCPRSLVLKLLEPMREAMAEHPSVTCRTLYYDVLMAWYDVLRGDEEAEAALKVPLLHGLCDRSSTVATSLLRFWDDEARLSADSVARLREVLSAMYHPDVEQGWLRFSTQLMLALAYRSPDFERPLFEPLSQTDFYEYSIDSSAQRRSLPMTPLFSASLSSQMDGDGDAADMDVDDVPASPSLSASQAAPASPRSHSSSVTSGSPSHSPRTASSAGGGAAGADHFGSSQSGSQRLSFFAVQATVPPIFTPTPSTQTGNAVASTSGVRQRRTSGTGGGSSGTATIGTISSQMMDTFARPWGASLDSSQADGSQHGEIRVPKRFFRRAQDNKKVSNRVMVEMRLKQRLREERRRRQQAMRSKAVVMYRHYRTGELPDVCVSPKELLQPLQALASADSSVARLLFAHCFRSILTAVDTASSEGWAGGSGAAEDLHEHFKDLLEELLRKSRQRSPPFVGCVLQLCQDDAFDVALDPHVVGSAAVLSNNLHSGVVLLEKQMLQEGERRASASKRGRGRTMSRDPSELLAQDEASWMQLAQLYRKLGDEDVLMGLYEKHVCKSAYTRRALEAELAGDVERALSIYEEAVRVNDAEDSQYAGGAQGENVSEAEETLWFNGRLDCFARLGAWEELRANTLAEVEGDEERLLEPAFSDTYLGHFLRSSMKLPEHHAQLSAFLDRVLKRDKHSLPWDRASVLAFLALCGEDYDRARFHVSEYLNAFLARWASLHPLAESARTAAIQGLQWMVEADEFLRLIGKENNLAAAAPVQRLLAAWGQRYPSPSESDIAAWDDVVGCRSVMLDKLAKRFREVHANAPAVADGGGGGGAGPLNVTALCRELVRHRADFFLHMAEGARMQGNYTVAELYLKRSLKESRAVAGGGSSEFSFPFFESLVRLYSERAERDASLPMFMKALEYMDKRKKEPSIVNNPVFGQRYMLLKAEIYDRIATIALHDPDKAAALDTDALNLSKKSGSAVSALYHKAYGCYDRATTIHREHRSHAAAGLSMRASSVSSASSASSAGSHSLGSSSLTSMRMLSMHSAHRSGLSISLSAASTVVMPDANAYDPQQAAHSFFRFALFCDEQLKRLFAGAADPEEVASSKNARKYAETIVVNMLEAMSLHSAQARDRFPRVLQLIGMFPSTQAAFEQRMSGVPMWMCIRWISQMMGLLDKAASKQVLGVLTGIAEQYPQALYYPFKISSEGLDEAALERVAPVRALLSRPLLDQFVCELERLTHPEHRFKDRIEEMKKYVPRGRGDHGDQEALVACFEELVQDVCNTADRDQGHYNAKFAQNWAGPIQSTFGKGGSKLIRMDLKSFTQAYAKLNEKMTAAMVPKGTNKKKLADFSKWLDLFDSSDHAAEDSVEIPGQYHGLSKPDPSLHIHISSFDSDVLVMGSLRKPKRLKIRGNDEADHAFLVKGGEDLRLDQRVQQLFSVMNAVFAHDTACCKRHLNIRTYQVVPMTTKVGILQWLDNTRPIKAIVEEEIAKDEGKPPKAISITKIPAAAEHEKWLQGHARGAKRLCDKYFQMYERASRTDTMKKVERQHATVRWDLLRRAIMSLSASPEAYLTIRSHFVRSLAAFNIASYIIGIGDRHLENFLLSHEDGGLIGIDFGHAFGTATQFLPIPELVPFRLTRQFTNFLLPLDTEGLLNHNMAHTLRALKQNKDVLLNTMDIFITEPLVDWEKLARRLAVAQDGDDASSQWFPSEKLRIVERKLNGDNPAAILMSELRASVHKNHKALKYLEAIVRGAAGENLRADAPERCESVGQQVACLVDLATDPNVLGRMYAGWAPWI